MGTRGFIGFVVDGVEKITYNGYDSYPDGLGVDSLAFATAASDSISALRDRAMALRLVSDNDEATAEDIARLRRYADTRVSTGKLTEWYVLLREAQGDWQATLDAGVMVDATDFPLDSLFAEWGYIIDLDTMTFEVYRGFQKAPHDLGRFAKRDPYLPEHRVKADLFYAPVALVASWPLQALPTEQEFLATFIEDEDDE
jgi:hypothetical protein